MNFWEILAPKIKKLLKMGDNGAVDLDQDADANS